jgi:uncharacterized membrane protein YjgN (DUF898 family)
MDDSTPPADSAAPIPAIAPQKMPGYRIEYSGTTGELYKLWLKKVILGIFTLGIYSFWGKTNIRRYMASSMRIKGDPFFYLGTGKELFVGFLKIIPFYIVFVIVITLVQNTWGKNAANFIILPLVLTVMPLARYAALRYRVNRFAWRGIRGQMGGSALSYVGFYLVGLLKKLFTLGLMAPSVDLDRFAYKIANMSFGDLPFEFSGDASRLKKTNITTLLLAIPTLGFSRVWYGAALMKEMARGLRLGDIRFKARIEGGEMLKFSLVNLLIFLFTLGLGMPVIMQRGAKFLAERLIVGGDLDAMQARQAPKRKVGAAEGMEDVFGIADEGLAGLAG